MDDFQNLRNVCRVCLRKPEELGPNHQMIFLNSTQIEKLIYVGDSHELVRLEEEHPCLCSVCESKLNNVYDFVTKFNSSKLKLIKYVQQLIERRSSTPEPSYCDDRNRNVLPNLDEPNIAEDSTSFEDEKRQTEYFLEILENENPYECEEFQITEIDPEMNSNRTFPVKVEVQSRPQPSQPISKPKIPPKSKMIGQQTSKSAMESNRIKVKSVHELEPKVETASTSPNTCDISGNNRGSSSPTNGDNICHLCKKQFSTRANMLRHVREHLGRRFICKYKDCNAFFTQKSSLQVHLANHEGLKPYACDWCDKKFSQSKSLVFHLRIHTGESPFKCEYCERSFKQKSNLIRHFKSHRKPQPPRQERFKCEKCSAYLASKQSLIRHLNRHDRMDTEPTRLEAVKIEKNLLNEDLMQ